MPIHYQYIFHLSSYHVFSLKYCSCASTSERKRVIAEPEGALAKSLKNMVVPEKSDITTLILALQLVTQNVGPTPAYCTHTSLATLLALPHRTCTPAKGMPISVA